MLQCIYEGCIEQPKVAVRQIPNCINQENNPDKNGVSLFFKSLIKAWKKKELNAEKQRTKNLLIW